MTNLSFKIIDIVKESGMLGNTHIKAECVQDEVKIRIIIPTNMCTRGIVKEQLIKMYTDMVLANKDIKIGDII